MDFAHDSAYEPGGFTSGSHKLLIGKGIQYTKTYFFDGYCKQKCYDDALAIRANIMGSGPAGAGGGCRFLMIKITRITIIIAPMT